MKPYYLNARPEVSKLIPVTTKRLIVLEVGCGVGNFRKNFNTECEYWGIEPFSDAAKIASETLDKVLVGSFRDVWESLPNNYFDVVVCNDVIEHMDNEDWFLQNIQAKMTSDGVLVGSIPNVRFVVNLINLLMFKDWKYVDAGILDRTHLRFFTQKSLIRTFCRNNWFVEEFKGINEIRIDKQSVKKLSVGIAVVVCSFLFGKDSKYLQFAFRVRKTPSTDNLRRGNS